MTEKKREPFDIQKMVDSIEANKQASEKEIVLSEKEALKTIRKFYLQLIEAGFTSKEAMSYIAALTKVFFEGNNK